MAMSSSSSEQVTSILLQVGDRHDGPAPLDRLLPIVYEELRAIADRQLRAQARAQTISATELVHEAYLRLADATHVTARGRAYFFAAAAQAMRRIIVDHARRSRRLKRGGGERAVTLDDAVAVVAGPGLDVLELERGLEGLTAVAERAARVVAYRFYGGLSIEDIALTLGLTTRTVNRDWQFARAWLYDYLRGTVTEAPP
jgi:RNA polymerase sigma-70 factor, ECF subfamily